MSRVSTAAADLPREVAAVNVLDVMCPTCGVPSGPCLDVDGRTVETHARRFRELVALVPKSERQRIRRGSIKRRVRTSLPADERRRRHAARMYERHVKLREAGLCVNGEKHGAAVKGGRCAECWERKLAAERRMTMEERRTRSLGAA